MAPETVVMLPKVFLSYLLPVHYDAVAVRK